MCIIQIWTTSACSSARKLVEKSHVCPWVNFEVPCKRWEWNSNIWASWLSRKDWETWFFNSCNSKTRLKIMKLGMVTWHGTNMPRQYFWPNWDKLWCKHLANWSFPQEGSWFREGTCHLRVRNDIRTLPCPALIFLHRQIRPNRSIVLNLELFRVRLAFLYINWVSGHLMCIIEIWTTSTCSRAPKLVEKSHLCPRVNF